MHSRSTTALSAVVAFGLLFLTGNTVAQQKSLKEQLVGTWTLVSTVDVKEDGTRVERWGANPKGNLVFDANGRYSLMIVRADLPKFGSKAADQGTAEENKTVMQGMVAHFGTYSINEGDKTMTTRVEGSWFPNLVGADQKRTIMSLTSDELKYVNPASAFGTKAEVIWRRAR
jgi:hypothetical protein